MAQSSYTIANSSGAVFRARVNELAAAIQSGNSGATAPSDPVAGMEWFDTSVSPPVLRVRNGANDAWNVVLSGEDVADMRATLGISTVTGRNKLINGNFAVNQRNVSGTVTLAAGAYGHDRWKAGASGCTYTFASSGGVTTLTITAGSLIQVVEGANLTSGDYVLSWSGTAQGKIGAGSYAASGVTASVTGGSNLNIEFNTGTLSLVQFEQGVTATPFDHRLITDELNLCFRYYQLVIVHVQTPAAGSIIVPVYLGVIMRATPTATQLDAGTSGGTISAATIGGLSTRGANFQITASTAAAFIIGRLFSFSAEL